MGLDVPLPEQYINFVKGAVRLDFGKSYFTKENVMDALVRSFKVTVKLAAMSFLFACVIGLTCGMIAAVYRGKWIDSLLMTLSMGRRLGAFILDSDYPADYHRSETGFTSDFRV